MRNTLNTLNEVREYLKTKFPNATIEVNQDLCPGGVYKYTRSSRFFEDLTCAKVDIQEALDHGYYMEEIIIVLNKDDNGYSLRVDVCPIKDCIDMEQ